MSQSRWLLPRGQLSEGLTRKALFLRGQQGPCSKEDCEGSPSRRDGKEDGTRVTIQA